MSQYNQENDIKAKNGLIKTLTIGQLLKRWNDRYSLENIYEIASQCCFGIYFKLPQERKICLDIEKYLDELISRKSNISSNTAHYIELKGKFYNFISAYPLLLEKKPGYVRLATPIEEEISSRCTTGSINYMIIGKKITPIECNYNTFGFVKDGDRYIAESYFRQSDFVAEDDCFVFVDQIEQFEKQPEFNICEKHFLVKNAQNDLIDDRQTLGRKTIKQMFPNLTTHQWDKFFEREKNDGLHEYRVPKLKGKKIYYYQDGICTWLIREGYYKQEEIDKIIKPTANSMSKLKSDEEKLQQGWSKF